VLFNSYAFLLCFLPAALAGYAAAIRLGGVAAAQLWLILASCFFYGWWNPANVPLLAASILVNNAALRLCARRGPALAVVAAANLVLLGWFKYLRDILAALAPAWAGIAPAHAALPLGISFFTFTQIALLLDARADPGLRPGLRQHALFVTFFPHLIAGPLLHHREMTPQFAALAPLTAADLGAGLGIFAIGLAKKGLIADPLAPVAAAGYAHPAGIGLTAAWMAALAYSMQLYFDFSGYSDMAIGLARLFGLRFPANFASPYKAASVIEYWQRWHITLTRFLTQYVYTPAALAAGRRCGRRMTPATFALRVAAPVTLTMALAGIWHGSGLTFAAFGLLHALYLVLNHGWRLFRPRHWPAAPRWSRVTLTYLCVLAGSVLFRTESLSDARAMLAGLAGLHGGGPVAVTPELARGVALIGLAAVLAFLAPNTQQIMARAEAVPGAFAPTRMAWRPSLGWAAVTGATLALGLLALGQPAEFLYFQF